MIWGDGLAADPQALRDQARGIRTSHTELSEIRNSFASLDTGGWSGQASEAEARQRSRTVEALDRQLQSMTPVASALEAAADSFSEIQYAQQRQVEKASRWEYAIQHSGWIENLNWGNLDPRRAWIYGELGASVVSLTFRLNTADGALVAKLVWNDIVDGGRNLWDAVTNGVEDGLGWVDDKISEGMDWLVDRWNDDIMPRLSAGGEAFGRLIDDTLDPPRWLERFLETGKPPYLSEVLGEAITVGARGVGVIANLVTGEDLHIADDGRPYVGETRVVGPGSENAPSEFNGINDVMEATMDTYNPYGHDRHSVTVTAVVGEDGQVRYVASIPGTVESITSLPGWGGSESGLDWAANFYGIGEGPTSATDAAAKAIEQSIAKDIAYRQEEGLPVPEGKPELLLTGHSQGGIVAGQLLTDPSYLEGLNTQGIVSAGSPQQTLPMDPNIPVYNFQTEYDAIPRADLEGVNILGVTDPAPNVTNVTLPHSGQSLGDYWLTYTHDQGTYMNDIQALSQGQGSAENLAYMEEINSRYGNFFNGTTTTYKTEFGREYGQ